MSGRTPPEQHAPPVQRLRVRYAKRGRARFASHRDFSRAFERALRRAGVPMAYSSGFSPHPRISYVNAAPTGAASEAEYAEIALAEVCDPAKVRTALNSALPVGLSVLEVVAATGGLGDRLTGSVWRVEMTGVDGEVLARAVQKFLAEVSVPVERLTKTGMRGFDARAAVVVLAASGTTLTMVVEHQTPLVRPDDVLRALARVEPGFAPPVPPVVTRLAQGTLDRDRGTVVALS